MLDVGDVLLLQYVENSSVPVQKEFRRSGGARPTGSASPRQSTLHRCPEPRYRGVPVLLGVRSSILVAIQDLLEARHFGVEFTAAAELGRMWDGRQWNPGSTGDCRTPRPTEGWSPICWDDQLKMGFPSTARFR
ncbi:hypothetical protein [Streptomyces sp. NPDC054940]